MLENVLRAKLMEARVNKNSLAKNILGVVLGDIQNLSSKKDLSESDKFSVITKLIKNNTQSIDSLPDNDSRKKELIEEITILESILPPKISRENIVSFIREKKIPLDKNNLNKSIGLTAKSLKNENIFFDNDDVRTAVVECLSVDYL